MMMNIFFLRICLKIQNLNGYLLTASCNETIIIDKWRKTDEIELLKKFRWNISCEKEKKIKNRRRERKSRRHVEKFMRMKQKNKLRRKVLKNFLKEKKIVIARSICVNSSESSFSYTISFLVPSSSFAL